MTKTYFLTAADGSIYESTQPGELGGYKPGRIYGRLDCASAIRALPKGYAKRRVFFKDEESAIAAGYRPCGKCMTARYNIWNMGGVSGTEAYPWKRTPQPKTGVITAPPIQPAQDQPFSSP